MKSFFFNSSNKCNAKVALICLPHAGGNVHTYQILDNYFPKEIGVFVYQTPGRGYRVDESPTFGIQQLINEVVDSIRTLGNIPYIILGHSFGGLLAFEVVKQLRNLGLRLPFHFIAFGSLPPPLREERREKWSDINSNGQMFDRLVVDGGVPPALVPHREAFLSFMPSIRSEYQILALYKYVSEPIFDIALTLFCGSNDKLVDSEEMKGWKHLFNRSFFQVNFSCGHFFNETDAIEIAKVLREIFSIYEQKLQSND